MKKKNGQIPFALKNVSFQINRGDFVLLVGRTGSGKSTLLMSMLGLVDLENG